MSTNQTQKSPSFPLISHPTNASFVQSTQQQVGHNFPQTQCKRFNYQENYNYQYYEEYRKLYFTAYCLSIQLKKIMKTKEDLTVKLFKIQKKVQEEFKDQLNSPNPDRKKRFRRTAEEIQRKFECTAERCGRNYGSEGSLQQHIKLKHPELYAKRIEQNGYHHYDSDNESL